MAEVDSHVLNDDGSIVVDQIGCARCQGEGHQQILYQRLTHPIVIPGSDLEITHWTMCPVVNEPIIMMFGKREDLNA